MAVDADAVGPVAAVAAAAEAVHGSKVEDCVVDVDASVVGKEEHAETQEDQMEPQQGGRAQRDRMVGSQEGTLCW